MPKTIRVYVPSTLAALAGSWPAGTAAAAQTPVFAVLDRHRLEAGEGYDEEELEFEAMRRAADAAAALVEGPADRPLVIAADVADAAIDGAAGEPRLKEALPPESVVSFHIDDDMLWYDVTEASALIVEL